MCFLTLQSREKLEVLQEADKHMTEANKSFENASEDCSNVPESHLEPLRLNLELPDYSRLDKPKKPPVPEVSEEAEENLGIAVKGTMTLVKFLSPLYPLPLKSPQC